LINLLTENKIPQKLLEFIREKKHSHKIIALYSSQIFFNLALNKTFTESLFDDKNTKENLISLILVILKSPTHPQVACILLEILLGSIF
jgi:hypothetical protein